MRIRVLGTLLCVYVFCSGQLLRVAAQAPQGAELEVAGMPTGASPNAANQVYTLKIYYTDPTGKFTSTMVQVPNIPVTAGLPMPTAAQVTAASKAKQMAVVAAINNALIPIMLVEVNGVKYFTLTAVANMDTTAGKYPTGMTKLVPNPGPFGPKMIPQAIFAPTQYYTYTVNGVTQKVTNPGNPTPKYGPAIYRTNNVTGEVGNGSGSFTPGKAAKPGSSAFQMTFGGMGALAGLSTGLDASGDPSIVGFGFIDETGSTPVDYFAWFDPPAGMDDLQVLTDLTDMFNADYASDGYTAWYNIGTDTVTINQALPDVDLTWSADSDTGLFLQDGFNDVPEPGSLLLLGTGAAGLVTLLRRKRAQRKG